ncbi:MAG: transport protein RbsD/FucU [Verrucomicrobiales bacterium]|nr:transport protein RbsD/FucU [Verrucomicrobiales bacterium]|tara:strand:+ start:369 stop:758 length:390 start_codon:yes stop_codon:yes gene_type:complete
MITTKILNPHLVHLLSRIRHTNTLVIADYAFPFWTEIETVDLTLLKGIPTIPQVLDSFVAEFVVGPVFMAKEFVESNSDEKQAEFRNALGGAEITFEPHIEFKKRVPKSIGLVRTADTTPYGNLIIESA